MSQEYIDRAIELMLDVPARSEIEHSAWVCRSLTEFGLALEVFEMDVQGLDAAVEVAALRHSKVPQRFAKRLRGIRERQGIIPSHYPLGYSEQLDPLPVSSKVELDAAILGSFSDLLRCRVDFGASVSALDGAGVRAYEARRTWRPTNSGLPARFKEKPDLPTQLLWRGWFSNADGPVMVVVDEQLDSARMDIWWGVHNGTHLDHLSAFNDSEPARLEYGEGLIVAEQVAMSAELLAGAEAMAVGNNRLCEAIADGLEERIGRLNLVGDLGDGRTYVNATRLRSEEFSELPVLSEAYVSGPLDLLRRRHQDSLLPKWISKAFEDRWGAVAARHQGVANFLERVRS